MLLKLCLKRHLSSDVDLDGLPPGLVDFDYLIKQSADGYDQAGKLLFRFRKSAVSSIVNERSPLLELTCKPVYTTRVSARGPQAHAFSGLIGYDLNLREGDYVSETGFTKNDHEKYKDLWTVFEEVSEIFRRECPEHYYFQERLPMDPHFRIARTGFNQGIVNKSFRTHYHRDKGNVPGTMSNLVCLGLDTFRGGHLVLPEFRIAFELRPRDYLGFLGQELWHGNTPIEGPGRLSLVCYVKKDLLGKLYIEEIEKMGRSRLAATTTSGRPG